MSIQSCSRSLKVESWLGTAPLQVFQEEEHVDIWRSGQAGAGLKPQAEAVTGALGRMHHTHEC